MNKDELILFYEYLKDESKLKGDAKQVVIIKDVNDLQYVNQSNSKITIQGCKTGICGGSTPTSDTLIVLSQLDALLDIYELEDTYFLKVQAGMSLLTLNEMLKNRNLAKDMLSEDAKQLADKFRKAKLHFWPVNPTEQSASIGGIVACDAKGIYAHHYTTKDYIEAVTVLFANNQLVEIKRNQYIAKDGYIDCHDYHIKAYENDLIDMIIGSEGQYGIIVDVTIKLVQQSSEQWGLAFLFKDDAVFEFIETVENMPRLESCDIVAFEYADKTSIKYVNQYRSQNSRLAQIPAIDDAYSSIVYVELHGQDEEALEEFAYELINISEALGVEEQDTWALIGSLEIEKYHIFRHAIPEAINIEIEAAKQIDSKVHKLGTDIGHYNKSFKEVLQAFNKFVETSGIEVAVFGHIKDAHFHANFVVKDGVEFIQAKQLLDSYYDSLEASSTFFVEHGIGKLKKEYFKKHAPKELIHSKQDLKCTFDSQFKYNHGFNLCE